ncbi:MAG: sigma-54-dependent Fis family transcriptional regulator [Deltaproteobacteria bacterium]|nr:sigma-54-dependent Fis family transcriptional regulator [Deltaproteobacteria bacterium]
MSANVLIVDDDESMRMGCAQTLSEAGYRTQAVSNGALALEKTAGESFDVILLDLKMPGIPGMEVLETLKREAPGVAVIVITGFATIDAAVEAGRLGADAFLCKPFDPETLVSMVGKAVSGKRHALEDSCVHMALNDQDVSVDSFIGCSKGVRRVVRLVKKVAPTDSTVLITGETGSGKELAARMIHLQSKRRHRPFVVVDCGSLVETLFESEMFGHVKGSFTGALDTTKGKFEIADGGTLFLDEIANIDINIQARLLRVVQDQEISKVGSPRTTKVNVRIIAATNKELSREISENRFRKDLFYRLNVFSIHIPPLRERPEDIPLLAEYFLRRLGQARRKRVGKISEEAMTLLVKKEWPGNVRELKNAIERAIVVSENEILDPEDLMLQESTSDADYAPFESGSLAELEKREIMRVLKLCKGNRSRTAECLGINRKTLREKIRKYGISCEEQPPEEEAPVTLQ